MSSLVIAVDPGEMCGLFCCDLQTGVQIYKLEAPPFETVHWVEQTIDLRAVANVYVVVERFTLESVKMTRQTDALETIGALHYLARKYARAVFMLQGRSDRMRISLETMKTLGWDTTSNRGHVREAARHALVAIGRIAPQGPVMRRVIGMIEPIDQRTE